MSQPVVWIIGDWQHADFSAPLALLEDHAECASYETAGAALLNLEKGSWPAAILLVQSRPGQIAEREVERLHAAAPLGRLVSLVGPWCEGEMRSGQPLPGVIRVPWCAWQTQLMHELGLYWQNESSAVPVPRTATAADRIETSLAAFSNVNGAFRTAVVSTSSRASYELIADVLDQFRIRSVWRSSEPGEAIPHADLEIFDGWDQLPTERSFVAVSGHQPPPPRVLLLHFPRPADQSRAAQLGVTAVLAQPLLVSDLGRALCFGTIASC